MGGNWQAQLEKHEALNFGIVSLSPILDEEITVLKKKKNKVLLNFISYIILEEYLGTIYISQKSGMAPGIQLHTLSWKLRGGISMSLNNRSDINEVCLEHGLHDMYDHESQLVKTVFIFIFISFQSNYY